MNNINLDAIYEFEKSIYQDIAASQINDYISGSWNFENEVGQFKAHVNSEHGNAIMLTDNITSLGGNGIQPSPMQYILFGVASSFGSVIIRKAAIYKININKLTVEVKAVINYDRFFGIDDKPPVKRLEMIVDINTDQDEEKIQQLQDSAEAFNCCPSLFMINKDIDIDLIVNIHKS